MKRAHEIREQYRQALGPAAIAHIEEVVAAAPPPSPELVAVLSRVFAQPAGEAPVAVPAPAAHAA